MNGLKGSIEKISTVFDSLDIKNIGAGIKQCFNSAKEILSAKARKRIESQKVTIQGEIDSAALTEEIRKNMGENNMTEDREER